MSSSNESTITNPVPAFAERLRDEVDIETLHVEVRATFTRTVEPTVSLGLRE